MTYLDNHDQDQERARPRSNGWHFEKRISLDNAFFIGLQMLLAVWFVSKADSRIEKLETWDPFLKQIQDSRPVTLLRLQQLEDRQVQAIAMIERISKLESQVNNLSQLVQVQSAVINRIDRKLPTLEEIENNNAKTNQN